jgi:hypothetical protein
MDKRTSGHDSPFRKVMSGHNSCAGPRRQLDRRQKRKLISAGGIGLLADMAIVCVMSALPPKRTLIAGPEMPTLCQERQSMYVGVRHALRVRLSWCKIFVVVIPSLDVSEIETG